MDEHYSIIVEGDWGPEHAKSVKNKLQIHFQSKKKSQGGNCVVQYNDESNSATVLFKSADIRDAVLSQTEHVITIDTQQITLKVHKPSTVQKKAGNTGQKTDQACGNEKPTAGKFLEDERLHEKINGFLQAHALERSTSVRVENLPAEANNNKLLLELYFEKMGGPVEEVKTIPSEQAAIITFKEEDAKERVLKQENAISGVPVKLYPYFKSLDTVLYGGERPHFKLPEPITFTVHPAIREFLLKKKEIFSIKDQMGSHFCQVNIDKPDVLLSPDPALLKQKGVTRKHIDGWSENALDAFKKIMSNYTTSEWLLSHALWSKVENDVKDLVKDQVFTDMDASKMVLTLVGMSYEILGLKPLIEKILQRPLYKMERKKNFETADMEMTPATYSLLEQDGLKRAASPLLHTDYNKKTNRLTATGLHTEILAFKNWILEKKISMKKRPLDIDRSILEFLRSVDCDEMSRDFFISHGITAVYAIENGEVVVIGSTEKALAEAEKRVNTVLTSKDLTVEDQGVLQMPEWHDLKKKLQESFNTSKKTSVCINLSQRDKVIVTGFKEPVLEVSENLKSFIEKHTRIEESLRVKSHAVVEFIKDRKTQYWQHFMKFHEIKVSFDSERPRIKLSGERLFVQPAVTFLKSLADPLLTDTLVINKAGAKKFFREQGKMMLSMLIKEKRFMVVLQEDNILEEEENKFTKCDLEDFGQVFFEVPMPEYVGKVSSPDYFWGASSESPEKEEFVMVAEEIEPAVFQLCGETPEDLSEARETISNLLIREHVTIPIHDPFIGDFTREDVETLTAMQKELTISVQIQMKGPDSVVTLEGLTRDVHTAESRVRDMIRKVERNENRRHEASIISSVVRWQYVENGHSRKYFDILTSYELEMAFQKKQPSVTMKINNDVYEADLFHRKATRGKMLIELNRVDLQASAQSSLPSHWNNMKKQSVVVIKLTASLQEYAEVEKEFRKSRLSCNIIEIERIQNSTLWRSYMIKKEELEDKNKHKNNEKRLFHGTVHNNTDQINRYGFNRSYAGTHGALYGNGSYFAVDPGYSHGYSKPDAKGHKRMYLARVLVGDFTQGKQGLLAPPKKSSNSVELFDSVTNNTKNPSMFVVFSDVQAYPEYLITFRD